jgi:hypothetical protein
LRNDPEDRGDGSGPSLQRYAAPSNGLLPASPLATASGGNKRQSTGGYSGAPGNSTSMLEYDLRSNWKEPELELPLPVSELERTEQLRAQLDHALEPIPIWEPLGLPLTTFAPPLMLEYGPPVPIHHAIDTPNMVLIPAIGARKGHFLMLKQSCFVYSKNGQMFRLRSTQALVVSRS